MNHNQNTGRSETQHHANHQPNGQNPAMANSDWLKCCNQCVSGRATQLTNCGHLLCTRCLDPSAVVKKCAICQRTCSVMELQAGLDGLPEEIKLLFQPIDQLLMAQKKKVQQVFEFQKGQQNRLISNLKNKMKKMAEKWNSLLDKAKVQEEELKSLRVENEKLRQLNSSATFSMSSHPSSIMRSDSERTSSTSSADNYQKQQFLMNFTPLKSDYTQSQPYNNRVNQSPTIPKMKASYNSPASANTINPHLRMSVRTPQSQPNLNASMNRTPSPYQISNGSPSPRSLNNSYSMIRSSTPNLANIHNASKITGESSSLSKGLHRPQLMHPISSKSSSNSQQQQSFGSSQSQLGNNDLKLKANSALMRLSQTLAAKSMNKD